MRALELFAGIGGLGLGAAGPFAVVRAYDQDRAAGATYALNHGAPVTAIDLASVTALELSRHEAPARLLSPPCQPFTRRGPARDVDDARAAGLLRLIELVPSCRPRRVLVENVAGFHGSRAPARLVAALLAIGPEVRDVACCPSDLGHAVRRPREFVLSSADGLAAIDLTPGSAGTLAGPGLERGDFRAMLDPEPDPALAVPEALRARLSGHVARGAPLATFTRSYARAIRGAGPVLATVTGLRYFSPREILRLHGFPDSFRFPEGLPLRTRLRLAANSVHVSVLARLAAAFTGTGVARTRDGPS